MDTAYVYEIRVEGHLSDHWSAWFDGLKLQTEPNGETSLTGLLSDQAALYGVLAKIHNLNLVLVSVVRLSSSENRMEKLEPKDLKNGFTSELGRSLRATSRTIAPLPTAM